MTNELTRPMLRFHGGKWMLAPFIIEHLPPHQIYTEAFGGGGSVLLRKPRSYAEVYNDLDGEIVNLFRVVRDQDLELKRKLEMTPYARAEFDASFECNAECPVERARRTLVRSYMGYGGNLTRLTQTNRLERTGFRDYSKKNRRSIPAHDWKTWPEALDALCERLRGVVIENRDATAILKKHDGPQTVHYVDPPYVHSTRMKGKTAYRHELDDDAHRQLAGLLNGLTGMVVLSGYACSLYEELYGGWKRITRAARADGARLRTECLWLNARAAEWNRSLL